MLARRKNSSSLAVKRCIAYAKKHRPTSGIPEEVDELWEKLSEGGRKDMCGWLKDKFGLSWQIIPTVLGQMLGDKDPAKSQRVMQAMLQMTKIDINGLKRAYEQR